MEMKSTLAYYGKEGLIHKDEIHGKIIKIKTQ